MKKLIHQYRKKKKEIEDRLAEFKRKSQEDIFYELCFCLLTPQTNAHVCDNTVKELRKRQFHKNEIDPKPSLRKYGVRFHNNKSHYLLVMKEKNKEILNNLNGEAQETRNFLIHYVKGLGYKESSHFLRNIGYTNLSILDRHILKNLVQYNVIKKIPKSLTRKNYLKIEQKFKKFSGKIGIPMDHLDLLFWSFETGEIFK